MKLLSINTLNISLVIISLILAYVIPFELFLFSYAVLGPLHYLTEIEWLHTKKLFVIKYDKKVLYGYILLGVLLTVLPVMIYVDREFIQTNTYENLKGIRSYLLITAFLYSVSNMLFKLWKHRILFVLFFLLSLGAIENSEAILFSINVFLPTIIHVYVFTMLFMIYGALKTKNKTEYIPVLLLTIVPVLIFLFDFSDYNYQLSDYVLNTYVEKTNFSGFINQIAICFSNMFDFPHSNLIYKTQIFISFI